MAKLFIFAIGGTGARVLRSLTMLLASGQDMMMGYDVYPIILDCDDHNGDTKIAVDCIDAYDRIHKLVWKDDKDFMAENGYFKSNLSKIHSQNGTSSFKMIYTPSQNTKYGDFIEYGTMGIDEPNSRAMHRTVDTTNTKLLLDSLYNNDAASDDSELYLNMEVGFKGNPNVGCVVFHSLEEDCDEFKTFLQMVTAEDRVMIVGSLFGGTGSSGIPEIVRKIRKRNVNTKVGAVLVMPYFAPKAKDGGTIRYDIFNSKTKAAINYYEDSGLIKYNDGHLQGGSLNSVYFIGDPNPTILEYNDGGPGQKNPANIVELISAMSILHFVDPDVRMDVYKYRVSQYIIGEGVAVKQLFSRDLSDSFSAKVLCRLTSFTAAIKYFVSRIKNPPKDIIGRISLTYYRRFTLGNPQPNMKNLISELQDFWDKYKTWLNQLSNKGLADNEGNSHGLTLYSTEDNFDILIRAAETGKARPSNTVLDATKVDAETNEAIAKYKPKGVTGDFNTDNEECLLMHGIFKATTNDRVVNKIVQ